MARARFNHDEGTPAVTKARRSKNELAPVTAIEIDVPDRLDALALSQELIPFHSFLVQHDKGWVVHANAPGYRGQSLARALAAVDGWSADRRLHASCRVGGRPYKLGGRRAA